VLLRSSHPLLEELKVTRTNAIYFSHNPAT
jgi:hypothetical protein